MPNELRKSGENPIKDVGFKKASTQETDYGTGAVRDARGGKGAQKWLPHDAIDLISHVYEVGNLGRGWRNWENGMPLEDLIDSAKRHLSRYMAGDRSEPHLSQALWNLLNALQTSIWVWQGVRPKKLNNLPDHRHFWYPGMESPCPLSPKEIEWLQAAGLTPDTAHVDDKYLAGIIDGEGTISIVRSQRSYSASVSVYNNSYLLLQKLLAHFPGGHINQCREATERRATSFVLRWTGEHALEVVKRSAPFLILKKPQADLVTQLYMVKAMVSKGFMSDPDDALYALKAEMHSLNQKGPKSGVERPELNAVSNAWKEMKHQAETFLQTALLKGDRSLGDLLKEAKIQGINKDALKRAKSKLGIISTGVGRRSKWSILHVINKASA